MATRRKKEKDIVVIEAEFTPSNNETQIENPIPKEEVKMFFTYDEKQAGGSFDLLPAGDYEVIISSTEVTESSAGNPMIKAVLTIRNDVEQEGQKRKLFENYVATEKAMFKFHQVAKALEWGQGEGVANLEEFAERILYQAVKVKLKVGKPQNGYEAKNEIVTYMPTDYPYAGAGSNQEDPYALDDGKPIDISEDDLPF